VTAQNDTARSEWSTFVVVVAVLVLLAVALAATWQLGSPSAVLGVATLGVVVAPVFRGGLASLIAKEGGVSVEAQWRRERVEEEMRESAAEIATPRTVFGRAHGSAKAEGAATGEVTPSEAQHVDIEAARREAIERLMTEAAEWGWTLAHMGFKTPPRPQISWSDGGEPTIDFGVGGK
jgi:hypothetical protein